MELNKREIERVKTFSLINWESEAIEYVANKKLLSPPDASAKIKKSLKYSKVATWILYLSPATLNSFGKNICSYSSDGCRAGCLAESGRGGFDVVKKGRLNKTNFFFADRNLFLLTLYKNIHSAMRSSANVGQGSERFKLDDKVQRAFRLNGTSDLPWWLYFDKYTDVAEFKITETNPLGFMGALKREYPDIKFYDYTKNPKWAERFLGTDYHVTLSRSEDNEKECIDFIKKGGTCAIVFMLDRDDDLPATYRGIPVIDGDETDARFLDPKGVWVGLRWKVNKLNYEKNLDPFKFSVRKDNTSPVDWYPQDSLPDDFSLNIS